MVVEWNLSDKIILASPSKDVKPFEVIGKEYVREAVKRLKDQIQEDWYLDVDGFQAYQEGNETQAGLKSMINEIIHKIFGDKLI